MRMIRKEVPIMSFFREIRLKIVWKIFLGRFKEQSEARVFFRRNRVHVLLTALCVVLCIKQSEAPFLGEYNLVTRILFLAPSPGTVGSAFLNVLYNLGLAYMSALAFYLLVNYFPERKKEQKAFYFVIDHIERIDVLINQLLEKEVNTIRDSNHCKL